MTTIAQECLIGNIEMRSATCCQWFPIEQRTYNTSCKAFHATIKANRRSQSQLDPASRGGNGKFTAYHRRLLKLAFSKRVATRSKERIVQQQQLKTKHPQFAITFPKQNAKLGLQVVICNVCSTINTFYLYYPTHITPPPYLPLYKSQRRFKKIDLRKNGLRIIVWADSMRPISRKQELSLILGSSDGCWIELIS